MAPLRGPLLLITVLVAAGCGGGDGHEVNTDAAATITVSSPAFAEGGEIPTRFTCDGEQISPPLEWSGASPRAWALVVDDPDAPSGMFTHWVVLDIAKTTTSIESGHVPAGGVQVVNSSGHASYAGPCPPSGEHRYRFTVYALDAPTGLSGTASLDDAVQAIGDHANARGTLTAVYSRH
ncbi:MAG: YbhB/YbcL family Raf kinase inhibitor-like protein [Nocardioides sp.]|nr:YbhB/YbcL family Raf kinase inhibitor-like protein [Nocardioides sp.]